MILGCSLFALHAFFHCNLINALKPFLHSYFIVSEATLSFSNAFFFYANVIFLLPAGIILDRYPVKKVIIINMLLIIVSSLMMTISTSVFHLTCARFLGGIMSSFSFIACLKYAYLLLPSSQKSLASSIIIAISMLGGFLSQAPITILATRFGWRLVMLGVTLLGIAIMSIIWFFVGEPKSQGYSSKYYVLKALTAIVLKKDNWLIVFFITLLNIPITTLGAFFGIEFLSTIHGISLIDASKIISFIFVGMLAGSLGFGWLSNNLKCKKKLVCCGAIACFFFTILLLYAKGSMEQLYLIVFLIGFTSSAQVLGYPMIAEANSSMIIGTATSFASLMVIGVGYGLFLPLVGILLDYFGYNIAMSLIPLSIALSIAFITMLKER
jgi:MFS family permease